MKLDKTQIQKIDAYLKKYIKEWDIRLEIIDHLASKFEAENINEVTDDLLQKELGPYWEIKKIANLHRRIINKKYKTYYFNALKKSIKSLQGIVVIFATLFLEYYFKMQVSDKVFLKWNLFFAFAPIIYTSVYHLIAYFKGDKSYANQMLYHYAVFPVFFLNIMEFTKLFKKLMNIDIAIVMVFSIFLLWFNYNTILFFKKIKQHKKNYNAIKSLL